MTVTTEQAEALAWLADPANHEGMPGPLERIDTHSASVFLAGERAYKVKRAVRYSFLDFSTLERRRQACEAEVRLNQRTAPRLYLGVTPLTREASGQLALGGTGVPIEWVVVMRRFPQDQLLDRLAQSGQVSTSLVTDLADHIAAFHQHATPTPHRGGMASMRDVADDNARALAAGGCLPAAAVESFVHACSAALTRLADRLEQRRAWGFVRQCHGDLHLRNIVLIEGAPLLFDAIEFNDAFACIDTWYDVAFLLMDLMARGLEPQANALFNQYVHRTGDVGGLPLVPLFLACRAAIRAKTSLASAALEPAAGRQQEFESRARDYLTLAGRLLQPSPPRLVAVGGLSGSGKSSLAAAAAPAIGSPPGAMLLRSDVLRKSLFHLAPHERLGPEGYAEEVTREVYRVLAQRATDMLAEGASVVVDATFIDAGSRDQIAAVAERAGVPFSGVWLDAPVAVLAGRLRGRQHDVSDATVDVLARQAARDTGVITWTRLDATTAVASLAGQVSGRLS